jgi:hypothetical protein
MLAHLQQCPSLSESLAIPGDTGLLLRNTGALEQRSETDAMGEHADTGRKLRLENAL